MKKLLKMNENALQSIMEHEPEKVADIIKGQQRFDKSILKKKDLNKNH